MITNYNCCIINTYTSIISLRNIMDIRPRKYHILFNISFLMLYLYLVNNCAYNFFDDPGNGGVQIHKGTIWCNNVNDIIYRISYREHLSSDKIDECIADINKLIYLKS